MHDLGYKESALTEKELEENYENGVWKEVNKLYHIGKKKIDFEDITKFSEKIMDYSIYSDIPNFHEVLDAIISINTKEIQKHDDYLFNFVDVRN